LVGSDPVFVFLVEAIIERFNDLVCDTDQDYGYDTAYDKKGYSFSK